MTSRAMTDAPSSRQAALHKKLRLAANNWQIYLLILPGLIYYLIFVLGPVWGLSIAFLDYDAFRGMAASKFVGLENFIDFFEDRNFIPMLRNTLVISLMNLVFYFPAPIVLALLLNEVRSERFKRINQTIVYLPHFLSWVVIAGLTTFIFSSDVGIVNKLLVANGRETVSILTNPDCFWWVILFQTIWKDIGWGTILFLAAISQIDPGQYEAALIDGANKFQQILYITLPGIMPTVTVLLIMRLGQMMNVSFEQILVMYNPSVRSVAEIFDTYAYKQGMQLAEFSVGAAVGIFKSCVGLIMVVTSNIITKRLGQNGIY